MGTFKKFIAGKCSELYMSGLNLTSEQPAITNISIKDINGNVMTSLRTPYLGGGIEWIEGMIPYYNMTAYASSDNLENYNINDYQLNSVGTVTNTKSKSQTQSNALINTITIVNSGTSNITVNCIKFTKALHCTGDPQTCLVCGYYLDSPVTISPGDSKTITLEFDFYSNT